MSLVRKTACAAVLLAGSAQGTDLPEQIVLDTCFAWEGAYSVANLPMPLPGTLTFDMHYEIEEAQQFAGAFAARHHRQALDLTRHSAPSTCW